MNMPDKLDEHAKRRVSDTAAVAFALRAELRNCRADATMDSCIIAAALICNTHNRSVCANNLARTISDAAEHIKGGIL